MLAYELNQAWVLRLMGHPDQAHERLVLAIPEHLRINEPEMLVQIAKEYSAVSADLGEHLAAVRFLGISDAVRRRLGTPRLPSQQTEAAELIAKTRAALTTQEWEEAYQAGYDTTVEDALTQADAPGSAG